VSIPQQDITIISKKTNYTYEYFKKLFKWQQLWERKWSDEQDNTIKLPKHDSKRKYNQGEKDAIEQKATFWQCVFNMTNGMLGLGVLGLPFAFKCAGWLGGTFILSLSCFAVCQTAKIFGRQLNGDHRPCGSSLVDCSRSYSSLTSFSEIARKAFGNYGAIAASSVLIFEVLSLVCVSLVTMSDHLVSLYPVITQELLMSLLCVMISIPAVILQTARTLSYLSFIGTLSSVLIVLSVLVSAILEGDISNQSEEHEEQTHFLWEFSGFSMATGIAVYCFVGGIASIPSIYTSMKEPQQFESMIDVSFSIVTASLFIVAISGYYMFGSCVEEEVTISLATQKTSSSALEPIMKYLPWLMIVMAFTKSVQYVFIITLCVEEILTPHIKNEQSMIAINIIIKLSIIGLAFGVTQIVPSFVMLLTYTGLVFGIGLNFIFPAAAHLVLFHSVLRTSEQIHCWIFAGFSTFIAIFCTITTIQSK